MDFGPTFRLYPNPSITREQMEGIMGNDDFSSIGGACQQVQAMEADIGAIRTWDEASQEWMREANKVITMVALQNGYVHGAKKLHEAFNHMMNEDKEL